MAIKVVQRSGVNREEKSLHYTAEVAQFLDLNKPRSNKYGRKKLSCVNFLCMIVLRNKTVVHTFLPLFDD